MYGSDQDGGQSWVETPSFHSFYVSGDGSKLIIKGDINISDNFGGGGVRDGAQLTVTGTITGGNINSEDNSIVNAPSCDNVIRDDSSTCNAGPQSVDVDIGDLSQNSQILFGTYVCGSSSLLFAQVSCYSIAFVMASITAMLIS